MGAEARLLLAEGVYPSRIDQSDKRRGAAANDVNMLVCTGGAPKIGSRVPPSLPSGGVPADAGRSDPNVRESDRGRLHLAYLNSEILGNRAMPMPLKLYFHPLASFCHKALVALYENGTPFEPVIVDLADEASSAAFRALWPMAKMPVLRDDARDRTVAESTIVVEYLDAYYPGRTRFLPVDPKRAWQTRMWDRFYDFYIQEPMQKIVTDRLRPEGKSDPYGVEQATAQLGAAYRVIDREMESKVWATRDASPWPTARRLPRSSTRTRSSRSMRGSQVCSPISTV